MSPAVGAYRRLLRLYPRAFRDEYGVDMALLFAHQLRDEPAVRVWARGLVDLAITVPARHLEAHVSRAPNPTVPIVLAAVSFAGLVLAVVGGTNLAAAAVGLAVAVVAGVLAVASWRQARTITGAPRQATAHWWKIALVGAGVLSAVVVGINVNGDLPDGWWWPMVVTLFASIATTIGGLVLGIAHLVWRRPHNPHRPAKA